MQAQPKKSPTSKSTGTHHPVPDTSSDPNRLTKSEVEQLKLDKKESLAYAQKRYFPGARLR